MTMPEPLLAEALGLFSLEQPQAELIRHNENMTYKITDANKKYVLRIHKRVEGFSADIYNKSYKYIELVQSELDIISDLKNGADLPIQKPICGRNDNPVQALADGTPVTLLEWIEGQTVDSVGIADKTAFIFLE